MSRASTQNDDSVRGGDRCWRRRLGARRLACGWRLQFRAPTTARLAPSLLAQLFALFVGHIENDRAFAGVIEPDRDLGAFTLGYLVAGQIRDENALAGHLVDLLI